MADFGIGELATAATIASMAVSAVSGVAGIAQSVQQQRMANATAQQNYRIEQANAQNQAQAINAQQQQEEQQSVRAKADEMQRADQQLGMLRVVAGEMGSGGTTFNALVRGQGYAEGTNLARVDTTYQNEFAAGELSKQGVGLNETASMQSTFNTNESQDVAASNSAIGSGLSMMGSFARIGMDYASYTDRLNSVTQNQYNGNGAK